MEVAVAQRHSWTGYIYTGSINEPLGLGQKLVAILNKGTDGGLMSLCKQPKQLYYSNSEYHTVRVSVLSLKSVGLELG